MFLDEIYDRTPHFSKKVAGARLTSDEQRLLALVNGRSSIREIIERAGVAGDRAASIFARLRNVDLIRCEGTSAGGEVPGGGVAVVDADTENFVEPLRAYLTRRPQPLELAALRADDQLSSWVLRLRPRLLMINAKQVTGELLTTELGPIARSGTVSIVAVLDAPDSIEVDEMLQAGLHAVLVKPIHINDLERLLSL
jgi:hypothetical protein